MTRWGSAGRWVSASALAAGLVCGAAPARAQDTADEEAAAEPAEAAEAQEAPAPAPGAEGSRTYTP